MTNLLAAGGIEALSETGDHDAESMGRAFQASGARIACLCSSDDVYRSIANAAAIALKEAGAVKVFIAGRPGEKDGLVRGRAEAIDGSVYAGMNAAAFLAEVLDVIAKDAPEPSR
jgi:methylmalonyl-CoA mutase